MLIYDDTIEFDFKGKEHLYTVSHKVGEAWTTPQEVEGVTTVLRIINKPALMTYPMNKALDYLTGACVLDEKAKTYTMTKVDIKNASKAYLRHSQAGKRAGSIGHSLVEGLLLGKDIIMPEDPETLAQAESVKAAFLGWQEEYSPETVSVEDAFYSRTHNYAGKFDYLCSISDQAVLVDFKTTNSSYFNPDGIYPENFAQLGAYALGWEEMTGTTVDDCAIVNLPKDGGGFKVKALSDMGLSVEHAKLYFLHCLALHRTNKQFDWKLKGVS